METKSIVRGVRLSADKGRLVADLIRGKKVDQALNILAFTQKKASGIIKKCLESAIANAEHNDGADIDRSEERSTCSPLALRNLRASSRKCSSRPSPTPSTMMAQILMS